MSIAYYSIREGHTCWYFSQVIQSMATWGLCFPKVSPVTFPERVGHMTKDWWENETLRPAYAFGKLVLGMDYQAQKIWIQNNKYIHKTILKSSICHYPWVVLIWIWWTYSEWARAKVYNNLVLLQYTQTYRDRQDTHLTSQDWKTSIKEFGCSRCFSKTPPAGGSLS